MKLTVVGSGDAFGSGGRLQTCFHVATDGVEFLIDCGATSLIGMQHSGLDPERVSSIFISHLHGDHFSGLAWWMIHAHHVTRRTRPLTITGPAGIEERFVTAAEALFPGSTKVARRFDLHFIEYTQGQPVEVDSVRVTPYEVRHPSGAPPYALRIETGGKIVSYSGDTEWVDSLLTAANGADLFIAECFGFNESKGFHMTWQEIEGHLDQLGSKRILLTHMGTEMLEKRGEIREPRVLVAEDGMIVDI